MKRIEVSTQPSFMGKLVERTASYLGLEKKYHSVTGQGYDLTPALSEEGTLRLRVDSLYGGVDPQAEDMAKVALHAAVTHFNSSPDNIYVVGNPRGLKQKDLRDDTRVNLDIDGLVAHLRVENRKAA